MDECEDLLGGLHESLGLSWKSPTRGLLLVTDAPCHGWQYHSPNALDDYPNVPPEFRAEVLFERMKDMNIFLECYKVGTINRHVVGMMRIFAQLWRSIHHIPLKVIDLQSHTNLLADSVSGSVSNSILSASEGAVVPINPNGSPDVMSRLARRGSLPEVDTGDSLEDADPQGAAKTFAVTEGVLMYFAKGALSTITACKYVWKCLQDGRPDELVAKAFKRSGTINDESCYKKELLMVQYARKIADAFNKVRATECYITVLDAKVWIGDEPNKYGFQHYLVEELLPDSNFLKFNSNSGWVAEEEGWEYEVAQAFSHFSYRQSKRKYIIVDLQGLICNGKLLLTDVAMHSKVGDRLNNLDHQKSGFESFFAAHRCGPTCSALGLHEFMPQTPEQGFRLPRQKESLLSMGHVAPPIRRSTGAPAQLQILEEDESMEEDD
eukprot:UN1331